MFATPKVEGERWAVFPVCLSVAVPDCQSLLFGSAPDTRKAFLGLITTRLSVVRQGRLFRFPRSRHFQRVRLAVSPTIRPFFSGRHPVRHAAFLGHQSAFVLLFTHTKTECFGIPNFPILARLRRW